MVKELKVSVVVVGRGDASRLERCLDSVFDQAAQCGELIVVSNKNNKIEDKFAGVKTLQLPNATYGHMVNAGIKLAQGKYVAILDANDFVDKGTFDELCKIADKNNADVVKSKFAYHYDDITKDSPFWNEAMGGVWCEWIRKIAKSNDVKDPAFDYYATRKVLNPINDENDWDAWLICNITPRLTGIYRRDFLLKNHIESSESNDPYYCGMGLWLEVALSSRRIVLANNYGLHIQQDNYKAVSSDDMQVVAEFDRVDKFMAARNITNRKVVGMFNVARLERCFYDLRRFKGSKRSELMHYMSRKFKQLSDNLKINWYCVSETDSNILDEIINNPDMALKRMDAKDKAKLSIIVPFYNVSSHIDKCLKSIVEQTMHDIEIICVDDGSPDDSIVTVLKYWHNDPRITLLYQDNSGVSTARNNAINYSNTPYICFCDSDDYVAPNMCELLYNNCVKSGADLAAGGIEPVYYTEYNFMRFERLSCDFRYYGLKEIDNDVIDTNVAVWNKIFRRSIINKYDIHFPGHMRCEDVYFTIAYLMMSKNIYFIKEKIYYYVHHKGSISVQMRQKNKHMHAALDNFKVVVRLFDDYVRRYDLLKQRKPYITWLLNMKIWCACNDCGEQYYSELNDMIRKFIKDNGAYMNNVDKTIVPDLIISFKRALAEKKYGLIFGKPRPLKAVTRMCKLRVMVRRVMYSFLPTWRKLDDINEKLDIIEHRISEVERMAKH